MRKTFFALIMLTSFMMSAQVFSTPGNQGQVTDPAARAKLNAEIQAKIAAQRRYRAAHPETRIAVDGGDPHLEGTPHAQAQGQPSHANNDLDEGTRGAVHGIAHPPGSGPDVTGNQRARERVLTETLQADSVGRNEKPDKPEKTGGNGTGSGGSDKGEVEHGSKGGGRHD